MRDLLTHTSGLIYGGRGTTAVHKMYPPGSAGAAMQLTGEEFLTKLSGLPLLNQPGATWDYGFGLDVTGLIEETLTKQSLGAYLSDTIFKPLGMADTGFLIPPDKAARYARALPTDPETGRPQTVDPDATKPAKFECGGGLFRVHRRRLPALRQHAGQWRRVRRPPRPQPQDGAVHGDQPARPAGAQPHRQRRPDARQLRLRPWPGGADHTWHRAAAGFGRRLLLARRQRHQLVVDPQEHLVVVFMAHSPGPARWHYRYLINTLVYQALDR